MEILDRIKRLEHDIFGITQEESVKLSDDFYEAVRMMDGIKAGLKDRKEGKMRPWTDIKKELNL